MPVISVPVNSLRGSTSFGSHKMRLWSSSWLNKNNREPEARDAYSCQADQRHIEFVFLRTYAIRIDWRILIIQLLHSAYRLRPSPLSNVPRYSVPFLFTSRCLIILPSLPIDTILVASTYHEIVFTMSKNTPEKMV